jgi:hypothetical protein
VVVVVTTLLFQQIAVVLVEVLEKEITRALVT